MNIYQRIAAVQKVCAYLKKDTNVGSGNYGYKGISHDGVLNFVRDAIIEQGIVVSVSQQGKGLSVPGKTKNGADKIRFEAIYDVAFINIEKPEDRMIVAVEAHGEDSNDKAPGKTISYATKTAMLKTFLIETGENDEARMDESVSPVNQSSPPATSGEQDCISEAQGKRLFAICKSSGTTIAIVAQHFGFKAAGEIKKSDYKNVCEWAESKAGLIEKVFNEAKDKSIRSLKKDMHHND